MCVEMEAEVKTEEERTPPAQCGPAGRIIPGSADPLPTHQQGDPASASCSRGYNEIRGFSSLSLCFSDTQHSTLRHTQTCLGTHRSPSAASRSPWDGRRVTWNQRQVTSALPGSSSHHCMSSPSSPEGTERTESQMVHRLKAA